jgi:hypothetical protein
MAYTNNWTGQQFNGSTAATNKPYVSSNRPGGSIGGSNTASLIQSTSLLDQRDIYKQLVDLQDDAEWLDFMWMAGKKEATSVPTYYSFFNDKLYKPIAIVTGATIPASTTTTATLVLDSSSYDFIVAGDLLRCANGVVRVVSKDGTPNISVTSVTGGTFVVASATTASAFSNAQPEGSAGPEARRWLVGKLGNQTQIFRNALKITDVQNMSKVEIEINGKPYILPYEMIQGLQKHRGDISLAMWLGEASQTTFAGAAVTVDGPYNYQTTRGMDSYISNYGITGDTATRNVFTLADLTSIEAQLIANRAPFEYMIAGSNATVATISDFLKNLPSAGQTVTNTSPVTGPPAATNTNGYYKSGINSGMLNVNGRQIDLEAEKFMHGGFTFNLKAFKVLSNQEVMNYTGSTVQASAYFLPMGKVKTVGGGMVDYFRYRYLPQPTPGQGSSETAEIMTGGLAPTPTNQEMNIVTTWTSNMGLEVFAPNKFAKIQVGNAIA